jgi:hypothetical protein
MEPVFFPARTSAERDAIDHALRTSGFARVMFTSKQAPKRMDETMGILHGLERFRGMWIFGSHPHPLMDDAGELPTPNSSSTLIPAAGGTHKLISSVKEYAHLQVEAFPKGAAKGCDLLQQLGKSVLDTTELSSHVADYAGGRWLSPPKLEAFKYFAQDHDVMVCPEHVDSGLLTIIVHRASGGLQVFDQLASKWVDVEPREEPLSDDADDPPLNDATPCSEYASAVILVGHTLEMATGGAYRAALHRVCAPRAMRRLSLVLKLSMQPGVALPMANCLVKDLIEKFKRSRPSVNPLPGDDRASAVETISFTNRDVSSDVCPEYLCFFKEQAGFADREAIAMQIHGVLKHSREHPTLLNPYYTLWALREWAGRFSCNLNADLRQRIMELIAWKPTTVESVIRALAARVPADDDDNDDGGPSQVNPQDIKLVIAGNLIRLGSGDDAKPFVELCSDNGVALSRSVVQGLGYARFKCRPPPADVPNPAIHLTVVTQDGNQVCFKMQRHTQMAFLFFAFCNRQGISFGSIRFLYDGHNISSLETTPAMWDMEDGDVIDVMIEMCGD